MNEELQELIRAPREDLAIELKCWMDIDDKVVQAKIAKELLALRNHGGGYLVIGFHDKHPPVPDENRPETLEGFCTDAINNIIKRYAEPSFHSVSHVVAHPITGETHPVISVPGGAKSPVRCKSDSPDNGKSAKVDTYYIRRPGPESAPPQSGAEWDALLERCLAGRKEELLSSLVGLLGGGSISLNTGGETQISKNPFTELREFRDEAISRLEELQQAKLPEGDEARFLHGRYILSARFVGKTKQLQPSDLIQSLSGLKRYTGWSPMYIFTRPELEPYPVNEKIVECWLGRDEARDVGHSDFWRASTDGVITLVRGFQEDGHDGRALGIEPGTCIEFTLPAWRVAEFLLRIREFGDRCMDGPFTIQLITQWQGIDGRKLFSWGGRDGLYGDYTAHGEDYCSEVEINPNDVDNALSSVIGSVITPLMRRFSFFNPPAGFYEREIGKMLQRDYA